MITKWSNAIKLTNAAAAFIYLMVVLGGAGSGLSASTDHKWPATKCAMSEYTCTNGKCVQLNKYCDKINDCGDSSDEPRFCTRKYFMIAHPLTIRPPPSNRLLDKTFVWIWLHHPSTSSPVVIHAASYIYTKRCTRVLQMIYDACFSCGMNFCLNEKWGARDTKTVVDTHRCEALYIYIALTRTRTHIYY